MLFPALERAAIAVVSAKRSKGWRKVATTSSVAAAERAGIAQSAAQVPINAPIAFVVRLLIASRLLIAESRSGFSCVPNKDKGLRPLPGRRPSDPHLLQE